MVPGLMVPWADCVTVMVVEMGAKVAVMEWVAVTFVNVWLVAGGTGLSSTVRVATTCPVAGVMV